jgi:glycosyltransferase involved in cell wall biosynthesis
LRVCFIVNEIFHFGVYGGFGALTRTIGRELVKKGFEIYVLMPKASKDQKTIETLEGMTIIGMPSWKSSIFYKLCDADVYHSQDPSIGTYYARTKNENAKHIITFQDPRTLAEDKMSIWSLNPMWKNFRYRTLMEIKLRMGNYLINKAVHNADKLSCQAKYIIPKTVSMFHLKEAPSFLPNPVEVPQRSLGKAETPTVCFIGRWEPVKRVEYFFRLAKEFGDVKFVAAGAAHDPVRDQQLRKEFSNIPNLEMPGLLFGKQKYDLLEKTWILINTSIRECLPVSFLEAAAYKCAILSSNNPDDFAGNFGYHVQDEDFAGGLRFLLRDEVWREKGAKGHGYVKETHELGRVIDQHVKVYKELVE